jgi:UDP-glucose 4-epimerase
MLQRTKVRPSGAQKVLVTGGGGPIGRHIVAGLVDRGLHVVSYDHPQADNQSAATEVAFGELLDLPRLFSIIREHEIERLVHAADVGTAGVSIEMPVATVILNVEGTLHLLEAARLAGLRGRIVLLSSNAVYGDAEGPVAESARLRPSTPYGVVKVTAEQLGTVYATQYGLDVITLRLGDVYGPDLAWPTVIQALTEAVIAGESFRLSRGADQAFHLTHADDVWRAVLAGLEVERPSERVFNVSGGEIHSLAQIAALVEERLPDSRIVLGPGHLPEYDHQGALDITAADRVLGYRPRWGLARGVDDYFDWLLARRAAA